MDWCAGGRVVPNVVISGFMDGIALLIWQDQVRLVFFGTSTRGALAGPLEINLLLVSSQLKACCRLGEKFREWLRLSTRVLGRRSAGRWG